MITHAHILSDRPPIFAAPFGTILAGLVSDVPRYEREKGVVSLSRPLPDGAPVPSATAIALQSQIVDVLKHAPIVLDAIGGEKADANTIADAVGGKSSTVYKALYYMLDSGRVGKADTNKRSSRGRRCIEWVAA